LFGREFFSLKYTYKKCLFNDYLNCFGILLTILSLKKNNFFTSKNSQKEISGKNKEIRFFEGNVKKSFQNLEFQNEF